VGTDRAVALEQVWRFQCRIMPIWLSVNETKTPTM
jgi:hypothetical protein